MTKYSRRSFFHLSALAAVGLQFTPLKIKARTLTNLDNYKGGDIGIYIDLDANDVGGTFKKIHDLGFNNAEIYTSRYDLDLAGPLKAAMDNYDIKVHALFTLGPGKTVWNFYEGQTSIGLVAKEYRQKRVDAMLQLSDLAKACNIPMVETHVGYIPENPNDPVYAETIIALKKVVGYCQKNKQIFLYHAGQESPTTLLRAIKDVGFDNQGIGMDTANLIMYDRGHPTNALKVYGNYIKLVNFKDGLYPTDPVNLGKEVPIGRGEVNFPVFIKALKESGYTGPVIIEREGVKGYKWEEEVQQVRDFLKILLNA